MRREQAARRQGVRALAVGLALAAAGCASAQAARPGPVGPPLAVPAAPPRVVTAVPEPAAETSAAGATAAAEPPDTAPASAVAPAPSAPRPAPAAAAAPAPAAEPSPSRNLQAGGAGGGDAALAAIRTELRRAARDLALVDYNALSGAGRLQYEQSRRFSQQAETALRDRNLAFAATLAEKAAALAAELAGG
jgi:hypothetical protein